MVSWWQHREYRYSDECGVNTETVQVALKDGWIRVWIGMIGEMDKYWIIPRMGDKERVGH